MARRISPLFVMISLLIGGNSPAASQEIIEDCIGFNDGAPNAEETAIACRKSRRLGSKFHPTPKPKWGRLGTSGRLAIGLVQAHDDKGGPVSSHVFTSNTEAAILARVIESGPSTITQDVAEYLLSMQLPRADEERVNELSAKARAGSLTASETQELDGYLHIGTLLGVMQSRARRRLQHPNPDYTGA